MSDIALQFSNSGGDISKINPPKDFEITKSIDNIINITLFTSSTYWGSIFATIGSTFDVQRGTAITAQSLREYERQLTRDLSFLKNGICKSYSVEITNPRLDAINIKVTCDNVDDNYTYNKTINE